MKKITSITAAGALAIGLVGITASVSSAAFTTTCVGEGGAVTIPGDLVVPAGKMCVLTGTVIQGDVRVMAGADLLITDGSIAGAVSVRSDAYFEAEGTEVGGAITARESFGSRINGSTVAGAVTTINNTNPGGFVLVEDSDLGGLLRATGGAMDLASSTVADRVLSLGAEFTDVRDSVVDGLLRIDENPRGATLCDSEVYGAASFTANQEMVQVGGSEGDGGLFTCDGSNYFGGNLLVRQTDGVSIVAGNIIRGNLAGTDNDPLPIAYDNRVRGRVTGQFAQIGEQGLAGSLTGTSAPQSSARGEQLQQAADERAETAAEEAEAAGPAF